MMTSTARIAGLAALILTVPLHHAWAQNAAVESPVPVFSTDIVKERMFIVPLTLDGATYNFIFDTETSVLALDRKHAKALSDEPSEELRRQFAANGYEIFAEVGNGTTAGAARDAGLIVVAPKPLAFGSRQISPERPAIVTSLSGLSEELGIEIAGMFPLSEIRQLTWVMEKGLKLSAYDPDAYRGHERGENCVTATHNNWEWVGLPVRLGAMGATLALDTGENSALRLTDVQIAELKSQRRYMPADSSSMAESLTGAVEVEDGRLSEIELGSTTFEEVVVQPGREGAIGVVLLQQFDRVEMDFGKGRFCFDNLE